MKNNISVAIQVVIAVAIVLGIAAAIMYDAGGEKKSRLGEDFTYDVSKLAEIDESLIAYKQIGESIPTGFESSKAITVDSDGTIYAAGDRAYKIVGDDKNDMTVFIGEKPDCIAVEGGRVYLGVGDHVKISDIKGGRLDRWQSVGQNAAITSIAVYKDNLFAADAVNKVVYRYDKEGKLLNVIGQKDESRNIGGFVIPSPYFDIAVGSDGLLRAVNPGRHRIEAYTFDGDLEFYWGTFGNSDISGFCGCCNPVNFAILNNDDFVTVEKGLVRVKIYDANGKFRAVVAGPEQLGNSEGIFDVAVDGNDKIYVLDTGNNVIRVFAEK